MMKSLTIAMICLQGACLGRGGFLAAEQHSEGGIPATDDGQTQTGAGDAIQQDGQGDVDGDSGDGDTLTGDRGPTLPAGSVVRYDLNSINGGQLLDSGPNGLDGSCLTPACPTVVPGVVGQALAFDGVDDIVVIPYDPSFNTTSGLTATCWVMPTGPTTGTTFLTKVRSDTQSVNSWELIRSSGDRSQLLIARDVTGHDSLFGSGFINDKWAHVAAVWDGSNASIWLDGVEHENGAFEFFFSDGDLIIGGDTNGGTPGFFFAGLIDEVMLFDRALGPIEIAGLAQVP